MAPVSRQSADDHICTLCTLCTLASTTKSYKLGVIHKKPLGVIHKKPKTSKAKEPTIIKAKNYYNLSVYSAKSCKS